MKAGLVCGGVETYKWRLGQGPAAKVFCFGAHKLKCRVVLLSAGATT